jgi:electron transfer flavoprotein alpha subunit
MAGIVAFVEHKDGKVRRASLETVSEARRLAEAGLGGPVVAVAVGSGATAAAAEAGAHGADRVHAFEDGALSAYATEAWARAVVAVVQKEQPKAILAAFTSVGRDLMPRVAATLGSGLVSDCVALSVRDGGLEARRPVYAGKAFATVAFAGDGPQVATLRPNIFALGPKDEGRKAEVVAGEVDTSARARVKAVSAAGEGKVELSEAQTIVSGGRGLKGPENFHLVEELGQAFGAAVGASRAIVDAGWVAHDLQVGQTGKTVSPTLYVACGISGAIQHVAGMSSAKYIVAINKDADAAIFKIATYGLVGDLFEILPRLTAALKAHFAAKG